MRHRKDRLFGVVGVVLLAITVVLAGGCGGGFEDIRVRLGQVTDPRLDMVIRKSIEASGGLDVWNRQLQIEGEAIGVIYELDGSKTLVDQQHQIALGEGISVAVVGSEPRGILEKQISDEGEVRVQLKIEDTAVVEKDPAVLFGAALKLRLEGQAMCGAAGLLQEGLTLRYGGLERKGGRQHHKIEASGVMIDRGEIEYEPIEELLVVWVDAQTYLIDRLWLRYQKPNEPGSFGYLAVNIKDYQKTNPVKVETKADRFVEISPLILPSSLEFVPGDQHQQFSQQHILVLEFGKLNVKEIRAKRFWPWQNGWKFW